MDKDNGFSAISHSDAIILILGSMPGQKSLLENQYYAHPRNSFWPIICSILNIENNLSYNSRCKQLVKHKIALWDVLKSCRRKGSLDADIENDSIEPNDFQYFFSIHTQIKAVFFNGAKAEQVFKKYVLKNLANNLDQLDYYKLPSTSPAHAAQTYKQKLGKWELINDYIT